MQAPIPVRPVRPARTAPHLQRSCWVAVQAAIGTRHGGSPAAIARALYGDEGEVPAALLRAVTTGATTSTPTWAQELLAVAVSDFLSGLAPASAVAALIAARSSMVVPIGAHSAIVVPSRSPVPVGGWVSECCADSGSHVADHADHANPR